MSSSRWGNDSPADGKRAGRFTGKGKDRQKTRWVGEALVKPSGAVCHLTTPLLRDGAAVLFGGLGDHVFHHGLRAVASYPPALHGGFAELSKLIVRRDDIV